MKNYIEERIPGGEKVGSWVENQRQEAFYLWRRYLAMGLHFQDGSRFDFGLYGGATNATLASFTRRPAQEIASFIKLKNRLNGIRQDEFLFANFKNGDSQHYRKLLDKEAMRVYENWKQEFGDKETFEESVKTILLAYVTPKRFQTLVELTLCLLDQNTPKVYEAVAWILQSNPSVATGVRVAVEENVLHKIHLERVIKVQKLYNYLCIL
jgi:hypothetical protein